MIHLPQLVSFLLLINLTVQDEYTDFLTKFGYLPKGLSAAQIDADAHQKAVKEMQRMAGLPETGRLDDWTKRLMKSRRCGIPDKTDIQKKRYKRQYRVIPWEEKLITYKIVGRETSKIKKPDIRRAVRQAAEQWSALADLKIEETSEAAKIVVSSDKSQHRTCTYGFEGNILAHAFMPPGGQLHINDDVPFSTRNFTDYDAPSLYAVVAHEIGHTLGFGHSPQQESVMYAYDIPRQWIFTEYDRKLMRYYYGTKKGEEVETTEKEENRATEVDTIKPDPCRLKDPVIVMFRNEILVFKNNYMWRVSSDWRRQITEPSPIAERIHGGPSSVDAAVQVDRKLWLFSGGEVFVTDGIRVLFAPMKLADMGLGKNHVRLAYEWHYFDPPAVYIWGKHEYWRLDESMQYRKADERYPKRISFNWGTVPEGVTSAFSYEKDLHFIKGDLIYRMNHSKPTIEIEAGYPKTLISMWGFCTPKSHPLVSSSNFTPYIVAVAFLILITL